MPPDLPIHQPWPATQQPNFLTQHQTPTTLFELLYDTKVIQLIVSNKNLYAQPDKGSHSFQTNADEIKTVLAILMISGYNMVPRRPITCTGSICQIVITRL